MAVDFFPMNNCDSDYTKTHKNKKRLCTTYSLYLHFLKNNTT